MTANAVEYFSDVTPPSDDGIVALGIDSTARSYDITGLALGSPLPPEAALRKRREVFITISAEGTDAFLSFSTVARTIDDTAKIAAGATLALTNTHCAKIVKDGPPHRFRLDRSLHKFLNVKAVSAATGTIRIWVSSPETP